jgi:hypothetical protein
MKPTSTSILALCGIIIAAIAPDAIADEHTFRSSLERMLPGLDESKIEELLESGELSQSISPEEGPLLVPGLDFRDSISADLEEIGYTLGVEVLNLIQKGEDDLAAVTAANYLLQISTLEGLEYYSASRDKMRTLFVQSFAIEDPDTVKPIEDPRITQVPARGSVYMYQQDKTFGKNRLSLSYEVMPSSIHMVTENITRFTWGIIPLIKPGNLRMHILILISDEFILYYGSFGAKAIRIRLLEDRIFNSFYNRLVALYDWFENKL